jgi:hypothetical protein
LLASKQPTHAPAARPHTQLYRRPRRRPTSNGGAFCAWLVALFASGIFWFVLPALAAPAIAALTLFYLALSSDTNG